MDEVYVIDISNTGYGTVLLLACKSLDVTHCFIGSCDYFSLLFKIKIIYIFMALAVLRKCRHDHYVKHEVVIVDRLLVFTKFHLRSKPVQLLIKISCVTCTDILQK